MRTLPLYSRSRGALRMGAVAMVSASCASTVVIGGGGSGTSTTSTSASVGAGGAPIVGSGDGGGTSGGGAPSTGLGGGSEGGAGGGEASIPDPIVSIADDSVYETRTDLKIGDGGLVVVAWVGHPATQPSYIGYTFSTDLGLTFAPPARMDSPGGRASDHPTLVVTDTNEVVLSWLGFMEDANHTPTDTHVYIARAAAGDTSFGAPVEVAAPPVEGVYGRPRLGITSKSTLIDVYERTGPNEAVIVAARSTDGATWAQMDLPVDAYFGNVARRPSPCALVPGFPTGDRFGVSFVGQALGGSSGGVGIVSTYDDGLTWKNDVDFADAASVSGPRCVMSGSKSYWLAYGFGSDTYGVNLLPMEDETVVVRIDDEGSLWSNGINEMAIQAYLLNPELVVDAAGNVDIAYYTGQVDGDPAAAYRVTRADGSKVSPSVGPIVRQPVTFALSDPTSSKWLGDYTGLATRGDLLATSYVDNGSGASHIAVHRMTIPAQ